MPYTLVAFEGIWLNTEFSTGTVRRSDPRLDTDYSLLSALDFCGPQRFAELRKRGVGDDLGAQTAGSALGPWRLANSPALSIALSNAYFDSLGIPRLTVKPIA
jgi:hypothetical protein